MGIEFRKVCNPLLPSARDVLVYLEVPDRTRWYANRGHLVCRLEQRLSETFGHTHDVVTTTATGTAALEASILATAGRATPERPIAVMPSYTFAATALAAEHCGYTPYFVDIDPETWAIDPVAVADHPVLRQTGVILSVAAYGRMPDIVALEALHSRTGIPVVVDAAAAYEQAVAQPALISRNVPICLSFHATKTYSTGEGGAVLWDNPEGRELISQATNFGFLNSRECRMAGFNGKLSEYHAAVGHAMLDMMDDRLQVYAEVSEAYRRAFHAEGVPGALFVSPDVSSAYALLLTDDLATMEAMRTALQGSRFGWRRWYEDGLHDMEHFRRCPRDPLPWTVSLADRLLGLPIAVDMDPDAIQSLAQLLARAASPQIAADYDGLGIARTAS
jgi:dTDP-4-amino-4,6-dideoxygalactose transaminase